MFLPIMRRRAPRKFLTYTITLNLLLALVLEVCVLTEASRAASNDIVYEDNEFAEFEEFDEEEPIVKPVKQGGGALPTPTSATPQFKKPDDDDEAVVEDEEDDDIFENVREEEHVEPEKKAKKDDLKFTKVPMHLRSNWDSYYMEILMGLGIIVYFINFLTGRNKNQKLANAWFDVNKPLLEEQFALVGDDGKKEIQNHGLIKETESVFTLWCSGRVAVDGLLIELKFLKRHDLVSTISRLFKPSADQIVSIYSEYLHIRL